jgi:hypothetical protein
MNENAVADEDESDEYDELLAKLGRTFEQDQRVSGHEIGHFLINRKLGHNTISEVTINPGDGYEGICRGARREAFVTGGETGRDASDVRKNLQPVMPQAGEDRSGTADIFQSVLDACTELMSGEVAEKLLLNGEPSFASDDRRQATELASLICKSPQAVERFIAFCEQQAYDLLFPHAAVLMSIEIVLRIRRTMSGEELDRAIAIVLAEHGAAVERVRRARWQRTIANAVTFKPE